VRTHQNARKDTCFSATKAHQRRGPRATFLTLSHLFVGKPSVENLSAAEGLPGPNLKDERRKTKEVLDEKQSDTQHVHPTTSERRRERGGGGAQEKKAEHYLQKFRDYRDFSSLSHDFFFGVVLLGVLDERLRRVKEYSTSGSCVCTLERGPAGQPRNTAAL